ncbi:pectinesterase [Ricinus communis]|uniref:Pectinesterase n=1 Tax=Ricinus communis TaxID=3988 RepID=B9SI54_RICCO|nr:pectinesterase [Ricinus communis]EEF36656.1 Pectinesterase-3 precursor, putative [Ricinus communis]|eukprot:XP_025014308.1 pectinesterase-like [Ricinus communis]
MDFEDGNGKIGNLIVLAFSFIVVAVVIVAFAATYRPYPPGPTFHLSPPPGPPNSPLNSSKSSRKALVPTLPTLDSICMQTDYVSTCRSSLGSVSNGKNLTVKEYLEVAINEAIQDVNEVKELSKQLAASTRTLSDRQALNDCDELLSLGLYELKAAFGVVSNNSELYKQSADVKNWLSAVLAYQEACRDGFKDKKIELTVDNALQNPKQKTSNALAIVDSHLKNPTSPGIISRSLISKDYPLWFSAMNRNLFEGYSNGILQSDAVVAADGSGQFKTIGEALNSYKLNTKGWYVIYVKAGVYNEHVFISRILTNVYMYGDGIDRTIISGSKHTMDGLPAYRTATVAVLGDGFVCKSMTIQNSATSDKETVALRVQADKAAIFKCKIEGSERSLYALAHRQFYRECIITGMKDIIYGDSTIIIQKSSIIVRKSGIPRKFKLVTAQGRTERTETTGFVLHDCTIVQEEEESGKTPTYLGRPGGRYARTIILQSYIGNGIDPEGWIIGFSSREKEIMFFAEFENHGPGADRKRAKLEGYQVITSKSEAVKFTPIHFIQGDLWLPQTGVPFGANLL